MLGKNVVDKNMLDKNPVDNSLADKTSLRMLGLILAGLVAGVATTAGWLVNAHRSGAMTLEAPRPIAELSGRDH